MNVIEPHIHMVSRPTDDYERLAWAHITAVSEPAFWAGYDRVSPEVFRDYYKLLTEFEPRRAAPYGIAHYCWICVNPKEAEDVEFSREVIEFIPEFLDKPTVLGIGEIGLNKNTRNEMTVFELQVELALRHDQLILIHTPHLADKKKGVRMMLDYFQGVPRINPERVIFDHMEEHTLKMVLDAGFWAGMTMYPQTKNSPARVVDAVERYGLERLWANSAADWGPSDPLAVPRAMLEMRRRGHREEDIETLFYNNPCYFLGQGEKFKLRPTRSKEEAWG